MALSKKGFFFILLALLANNLLWLYWWHEKSSAFADSYTNLTKQISEKNIHKNIEHIKPKNNSTEDFLKKTIVLQPTQNKSVTPSNDSIATNFVHDNPDHVDTRDIDIPRELSQNVNAEKINAMTNFFGGDKNKKLDAIQSLSAQGNDLTFIDKILTTDGDADIRAAALGRLNQEHSYAVTNILIKALDDPSETVSFTALNTLVQNGDRSLLPTLKEKVSSMPNGSIRENYEKSIARLEYSVTMGMDNIQAP